MKLNNYSLQKFVRYSFLICTIIYLFSQVYMKQDLGEKSQLENLVRVFKRHFKV